MNNSTNILLVVLACLLSDVKAQWYLRCRLCHEAYGFEECKNYQECIEGEACYVDEIITDDGRVVYNAGCRSSDICFGTGLKKRQDTIMSCSRCCDSLDYCNDHLCGLTKSTNGLLCHSCDGLEGRPGPPQYPEDCAYFRICNKNEFCFSSTVALNPSEVAHYSTCRDKRVCQTLTKYIVETYGQSDLLQVGKRQKLGKRQLGPICSVCCGDEQCNAYACAAIKRRILALHESDSLNMTTLMEII